MYPLNQVSELHVLKCQTEGVPFIFNLFDQNSMLYSAFYRNLQLRLANGKRAGLYRHRLCENYSHKVPLTQRKRSAKHIISWKYKCFRKKIFSNLSVAFIVCIKIALFWRLYRGANLVYWFRCPLRFKVSRAWLHVPRFATGHYLGLSPGNLIRTIGTQILTVLSVIDGSPAARRLPARVCLRHDPPSHRF